MMKMLIESDHWQHNTATRTTTDTGRGGSEVVGLLHAVRMQEASVGNTVYVDVYRKPWYDGLGGFVEWGNDCDVVDGVVCGCGRWEVRLVAFVYWVQDALNFANAALPPTEAV